MSDLEDNRIGVSLFWSVVHSDMAHALLKYKEDIANMVSDSHILQAIPIFSNIVKLGKGAVDVRDYLYMRKVARFIYDINKIPEGVKEKYIQKIQNKPQECNRAGLVMLELIDKTTGDNKIHYFAKLYKAHICEEMDISKLTTLCEMVDRTSVPYLELLLKSKFLSEDNVQGLINSGVVQLPSVQAISDEINRAMGFAIQTGMHMSPRYNPQLTDGGAELRRILTAY